ncbi:DUF6572 domain-containing protein [Actinomadura bangladeshensis]|uniref:Uncharacterized protein n=1 Tax=Actinomadura bangladeshensis TaxID=453573 RepID=A0A4R4P765_9ACTN|nr:DUF6572 domain-containing protein [Actinomadura bangladeshensis]TDC16690.1 hypothetical protein E1284_11625 [Actinomadura bangladeshensis]
MTVRDAGSVDQITVSQDESTCTLLMVEDRPFTGASAQHDQIMDKVNTYLAFLQGGQFAEQFPELADKRKAVRLVCVDEPSDPSLMELLQVANGLFARNGIDFSVEVIPPGMTRGGS